MLFAAQIVKLYYCRLKTKWSCVVRISQEQLGRDGFWRNLPPCERGCLRHSRASRHHTGHLQSFHRSVAIGYGRALRSCPVSIDPYGYITRLVLSRVCECICEPLHIPPVYQIFTQRSVPMGAPEVQLSANDAKVLSALFDPESSPSSAVKILKSEQALPHVSDLELPLLQRFEKQAILPLNTPQPSREAIEKAVGDLSKILKAHPKYSPAYANRAQALRMLIGDQIFSEASAATTKELFADLAATIAFATPPSPQDALSPIQTNLLATTHSHRGYLLMMAASRAEEGTLLGGPDEICSLSKDELEEMASRDFFLGGRYGDKSAQQMAVKTNPYAKMCSAIVKEAMIKEIEEFRSSQNAII